MDEIYGPDIIQTSNWFYIGVQKISSDRDVFLMLSLKPHVNLHFFS